MTYGPFSANTIQLGREATAGTAVAATTVWRGPAVDIEDGRTIIAPGKEENVGLLVPTDRTAVVQLAAMLSMPETELTFEQLPHILEAGIKTATPSGSGPYVRAYPYPFVTPNTIKTYTIETGNAIAGDGHEMEYGFVESFTLSGRKGEAWKMTANWRGRQKTEAALTSSLSLPAVEEALFGKTKLYIDAANGTIGTTQIAGVLVEASITVNTGLRPVFTGDGVLYFTAHKNVPPEVTFTLTMELESGGKVNDQRALFEAQTARLTRLLIDGSSVARKIKIDIAGKYTSVGSYQNSEDNTTVQLSGEAKYNSAAALFFAVEVTNSIATM